MKKFIITALAARVTVPRREPMAVTASDTAIMKRERRKRSRFTLKNLPSFTGWLSPRCGNVLAERFQITLPAMAARRSPAQLAATVPAATPSKPIPATKTSRRLSAMLSRLVVRLTIIGATVVCMPINQPVRAIVPNWAGAAQTQSRK